MADDLTADKKEYELSPDEATSFEDMPEAAGFFNRKKVLMSICIAFAVIILGGVLFNTARKKNTSDDESRSRAAGTPSEFLKTERDRRMAGESAAGVPLAQAENGADFETAPSAPAAALPEVTAYNAGSRDGGVYSGNAPAQSSGYSGGGGGAGGGGVPVTANRSPLRPQLEGSLQGAQGAYQEQYAAQTQAQAANRAAAAGGGPVGGPLGAPSTMINIPAGSQGDYILQNNQSDKKEFYNSSGTGAAIAGGYFLGDNALWPGVIIPAVLETAINTDLPGNIIARVTQNIYGSLDGGKLLIPQGTILVAKYNSSVSYAQHRVQIVWDALIRPDGFYLELEGMNGVDKKGMSGQEAIYHENWFEYLKAAGIITMFSVANSKMASEAAKYSTEDTAEGIVQGNAEFVNNIGSNIVGKAMNIQPTLTVPNGEVLNIMLNKTVYLPPVSDYPVTEKYIRK